MATKFTSEETEGKPSEETEKYRMVANKKLKPQRRYKKRLFF